MKKSINQYIITKTSLLAMLLMIIQSCYMDKGNYEYIMPIEPKIVGLDTLYRAVVGDSLIIDPQFENIKDQDLACEWNIFVPEAVNSNQYTYKTKSLKTIFGLRAQVYNALLTVTNKSNGIKYYQSFKIQGITEFSKGTLVLSQENGVTRLSFIKPDSTLQARVYEAINNKTLPSEPLSIHYANNKFTGGTPLGYWIISKHDGVRLKIDNLTQENLKPGTLKDNFFLAPENINVQNLIHHDQGVLMGIINGKFYGGTTSTWDQSNTYGMFGSYAIGDYELADKFVLTNVNNNYSIIGFEKNKKQFVRLNIYGSPMYFGTQYQILDDNIFDPTNLGMEIVQFYQINNTDAYAYCKNQNGQIYELKFNVNFNGPFTFTPIHKQLFINQSIINEETKIVATQTGIVYIANGNKVYRYTPINQNLTEINAKFADKITMLKLADNEQTLVVGSGNSLYYTNITIGNNGTLKGKINGIPGAPIDITWR